MSAPIAKSQLKFALPSLSYVDASMEEPTLRDQSQAQPAQRGVGGWIAERLSALVAWNRNLAQVAELASMSERELADMGLCRADIAFAVREAAEGLMPTIDPVTQHALPANENGRRMAHGVA